MARKHPTRPPIPQGRAPAVIPVLPQSPHEIDARSPMESDAAPTRLEYELMVYRVSTLEIIARRLVQLLPASVQGEYAPMLETETAIANAITAQA